MKKEKDLIMEESMAGEEFFSSFCSRCSTVHTFFIASLLSFRNSLLKQRTGVCGQRTDKTDVLVMG